MTETSRKPWRSTGAVLAGLLTILITHLGTDSPWPPLQVRMGFG